MARIVRSAQSETDALEIWSYIARDNVPAADRLLDKIDEKLRQLADNPGFGRARGELGANLRSAPLGNYLLFYRAIQDGIEVVRILHGARDLRRLFRKSQLP